VLRRIFWPKRDEVTGERRKLHDEELNDLYASPNIVQVIKIVKNEIGGACNEYGGQKRRIQGFGGETRLKETNWMTQAKIGLITYLLYKHSPSSKAKSFSASKEIPRNF
jgi:hypothetical protein